MQSSKARGVCVCVCVCACACMCVCSSTLFLTSYKVLWMNVSIFTDDYDGRVITKGLMALFVVCFVVASWTDAIDVFQRRITGSGNFFWLRVVFAQGWRSSRLIDFKLLPAASHNGGRNESVRGDRMSLGGERMVKWIFGRVLIKGEVKYLFALLLLWVWHINQNYPEQGRVPQLV